MTGTLPWSLCALLGERVPWSHRPRSSHGSWVCVGRNETWPPSTAGSSDRGPPDNQRVAVSFSLSFLTMGQDVQYVLDTSALYAPPRHAHHPLVQTFSVWSVMH